MTDTERLDFLQKLLDEAKYTGKAILRMSLQGRGWCLHETDLPGAVADVRQAIDTFMNAYRIHEICTGP